MNVFYCEECESEYQYLFNYVYNYVDHLGNIRMSYAMDPDEEVLKILEENHYYPFGLKHTNYNVDVKSFQMEEEVFMLAPPVVPTFTQEYKYKYNGKEWQDEMALSMYDYGARNYDPAIGRWMNMDPLAEQMRRWSPYNYCFNNPMRFIDPDGMKADDFKITGSQSQAALSSYQSSVAGELNLSMDASGNVTYTRTLQDGPLSAKATELMSMIDNKSITVNMIAENNKQTSTGNWYVGGAFMGNTVTSTPLIGNTVESFQEVNPAVLTSIETYMGSNPGDLITHEGDESYKGALIAQTSGVSTPPATLQDQQNPNSVYSQSHNTSVVPANYAVQFDALNAAGTVVTPPYPTSGPNAPVSGQYSMQLPNRPQLIIQTIP